MLDVEKCQFLHPEEKMKKNICWILFEQNPYIPYYSPSRAGSYRCMAQQSPEAILIRRPTQAERVQLFADGGKRPSLTPVRGPYAAEILQASNRS